MKADNSRADLRQALVLCAMALVLAWAPRLFWGFWTDEAGTFWMAAKGWREAIARCQGWTGQSILYGMIESFFVVPGRFQEALLRVPSLAGMAAAAYFTYQLAERDVRAGSGPAALVTLLCLPDAVTFGTSARPYALVLATATAATYFLLRWRETPTWRNAALYACCAGLLVNLHYLAAFLFVPHAAFILYLGVKRRLANARLPLAAAGAIVLAMIPIAGHLRSTVDRAATFAGAAKPQFMQLVWYCAPQIVLVGIALGLGMVWFTRRKIAIEPFRLPSETMLLLVLWLVAAPVAFFAAASLTSNTVFAARYLFFTVPAQALLVGWFVSMLAELHARRIVTCALFAAPVLHPAMLIFAWGPAQESWREPLAAIEPFAGGERVPVLIASGLIESGVLDWEKQDPRTSRLYAAVTAYPVPNPLHPLPYQFSTEVAAHLKQELDGMHGESMVLLCEGDSPLLAWFGQEMQKRGYRVEQQAVNRMSLARAIIAR